MLAVSQLDLETLKYVQQLMLNYNGSSVDYSQSPELEIRIFSVIYLGSF